MPTDEMMSVREYLSTSYSPDCEYLDGALVERTVGEWDHSRVQAKLVLFFGIRERQFRIRVVPEQRVQVKPTRFRIPDVCVVSGDDPGEQILTHPPFICIEILSRDDRLSETNEKVQDYLTFGVPYVWILDPKTRKAWQCTPGAMLEVRELRTENPAILVPLDEVFA